MNEEKSHGWTNRYTWLVNLWISNDQVEYEQWRDQAAAAREEQRSGRGAEAVRVLEESLESHYTEARPIHSGMYAELLSTALERVNWMEIAEHMIDEVEVEVDEDEETYNDGFRD